MDFKYYIIRFLQGLVFFSNFLQKRFIKQKKINLRWDEKILLINANRVWDSIWCVYFVKILRHNFPNLKVSVVANDYNKFIFEENKELFEYIYSVNFKPPKYLVKQFYRIFGILFSWFQILFTKLDFWKDVKSRNFDYVLNLTWREYFLVSKYLGNEAGWWLWIFNFLYDYPFLCHNEIWADKHIVYKRLWIFENEINDDIKYYLKKSKIKKVLLFKWWRYPNRLENYQYLKAQKVLDRLWYSVSTLSDTRKIKADFLLTKTEDWFFVWAQKYKDFLKKGFDFFVWFDGGTLHYSSFFIPTMSFYSATNFKVAYPFWGKLKNGLTFDKNFLFLTSNKRNVLFTAGLLCNWCFQVWCKKHLCLKLLDIEFEMFIKEGVDILNN